ncbi:hypothetical protein GCM10028864_50280 [Microlunatus parietis]
MTGCWRPNGWWKAARAHPATAVRQSDARSPVRQRDRILALTARVMQSWTDMPTRIPCYPPRKDTHNPLSTP